MALKEHPFVGATTTLQGDGVTIKYDITKPNRSDAVGKAFKIDRTTGIGALVEDGDEIDGKVLDVDDDDKFTAAYIFGGLRLPLGNGATVKRGDKVVGALGPSSAKGHIKAAPELTRPTSDFADLAAATTAVQTLVDERKGKGSVLEFDATDALVAFGP